MSSPAARGLSLRIIGWPKFPNWEVSDRALAESRATSMRRPAPVKPFSWSCQLYSPTADQREARLASSLSFLERFFVRPSIQPIADQREAHNAAIPKSQITDSPYFHPHSLWSYCPRCQLGVLDWKRVLPSRSRTECLCFRRRCSWRVPQSPELGDLVLEPVKRQPFSAPVVRCDCAMVRILHPSPTADEARSLVFAQLPQPLVSCRAFRHV